MQMVKNKKTLSILGVVGFGIFALIGLVFLIINSIRWEYSFSTFLRNFGSWFKSVILYGYIAFYLIYNMVKKSNKADMVINIILIVVFGLIAISYLKNIGSSLSTLVDSSYRHSLWISLVYIIDIIISLATIAAVVLLAINVLGTLINKKFPFKLLAMIAGILFVATLVFYLISDLFGLISYFYFERLVTNFFYLIRYIGIVALLGVTTLVIYNKTKEIK